MTNRGFPGNDPGGRSGLFQAIRTDVTLHLRGGLYVIGLVVSVLLALPLALLVPVSFLDRAIPVFILLGIGSTTMLYMAALILSERADGTLNAALVSPLSISNFIAAKLISLNLLVLFETVITLSLLQAWIALQSQTGPPISLFDLGFGLIGLATLYLLLGLGLVVRFRSLTDFLVPVLLLSGVIQAPALHFLGLFEHWGLLLIPSAAPTLIMMGAFGAIDPLLAALGYLGTAFWLVVLFVWSRRAFERHVVDKAG